jgi:hypothetical protein
VEEFTGGEYPEVPPVPQVIGDEVPPGRLPNENTANTSSLEWREASGTSDPVVSSKWCQKAVCDEPVSSRIPDIRLIYAEKESRRADSNRFTAHCECAVSGC